MRVLLDTNVILDVWLVREPFWRDSAALLAQIEQGDLKGCICPTTVTTLHYLAKKVLGEERARGLLSQLTELCEVCPLTAQCIHDALASALPDFEDAVIEAVALENKVQVIATRDKKHFRKSRIEAKEPAKI